MTDPVARDRLPWTLDELTKQLSHRNGSDRLMALYVIETLEAAGVLPPDALAKVRADVEALPVLRVGGDVLIGDPPLLNREAVLLALEAASGTPEPPAPHSAAEYLARSERAAADIATWPAWMQRNLTPPREAVPPPAAPGLPAELRALLEAAISIAEGRHIDTDGETGDEWCFFCDVLTGHRDDCDWIALGAALKALRATNGREGDIVNLVRLGHYHVPSGEGNEGSCQTALVVGIDQQDPTRAIVTLNVWQHDGDQMVRDRVQQDDPYKGIERGEATFHLSSECPWGK